MFYLKKNYFNIDRNKYDKIKKLEIDYKKFERDMSTMLGMNSTCDYGITAFVENTSVLTSMLNQLYSGILNVYTNISHSYVDLLQYSLKAIDVSVDAHRDNDTKSFRSEF